MGAWMATTLRANGPAARQGWGANIGRERGKRNHRRRGTAKGDTEDQPATNPNPRPTQVALDSIQRGHPARARGFRYHWFVLGLVPGVMFGGGFVLAFRLSASSVALGRPFWRWFRFILSSVRLRCWFRTLS